MPVAGGRSGFGEASEVPLKMKWLPAVSSGVALGGPAFILSARWNHPAMPSAARTRPSPKS